MAFTAGTGNLVFLDLVAHLVRKSLGLLRKDEEKMIKPQDFKFILYVSYPTQAEIIGFDLCDGLKRICKKTKSKMFQFKMRLSSVEGSSKRWD